MIAQNSKAYETLLKVSKELRMPKMYRTDLTFHDKKLLLSKDAPKRFGWILREHGTILVEHEKDGGNRESIEYFVNHKYWDERIYFYWDGSSLVKTTQDDLFYRLTA